MFKCRGDLLSEAYLEPGHRRYIESSTNDLIPPDDLCLRDNKHETLQFIHKLKNCRATDKQVHPLFYGLRRISPCAKLILAADAQLAAAADNNIRTRSNSPHKFFNANIEVVRGNSLDGEKIEGLKRFFFDEAQMHIGPEAQNIIYRFATEALVNVIHHAHPENLGIENKKPSKTGWWLAGAYDKQKSCIYIIILDRGIGIPNSLRSKLPHDAISRYQRQGSPDGSLIKSAFEGKSYTDSHPHRAVGMPMMRETINKTPQSGVRIISNHGEFHYRNDSGHPTSILENDTQFSIDGTLIELTLNGRLLNA